MKRTVLLIATLAFAFAAAASAKGPAEATISGPGVDKPIVLGHGEPGTGTPLATIVESTGFFAAVFGQSPDPLVAKRPKGDLGPRYTVTYRMPDPIRQDVYPYAKPSPVTYTPAGQTFWDTKTRGGWYVAGTQLRYALVTAGLPASAPEAPSRNSSRAAWAVAPIAAVLLAAVPLAVRRRRR